ncbi:DUF559 domain-containing protein [Agrobacterium tumefaciens]|uniref:endonuclease domain-containing protein n=1 Tax=Agrobacterium tumefaciens TaxID=358 RepID=UPI00285CAF43|nr:DUF559 domain-containing protein [Agrobacterium tumefaciens]MDR6587411.1 very-short-patch-repair endonuclease [Agrobacterium tumefaciens]
MDRANKQAIIIRGAITAVLFFAGFAFPLVWIVAAFFAYTTYQAFPDPEPPTPENMYRPRQSIVTADDPEWREYFLNACESPAETAFLEAMINGYGLKPEGGILVAPGIELDMQTEYKPYRLDFLVNKWLVVEVDGAAWHSSPEAVERDGIRDEFFKVKGFSVLRIPAKVVFNTPTKAVEMVRAAIARGRPQQKVVEKSPPMSVAKTFTNSAKSVGKFLDDVDAHVTRASAIQEAMGPSKQTFSTEQTVIGSALETAKRKVDLEAQLDADPNLRKHFDAAHAELEELMESTKSAQPATKTTIDISPLSWPPTHPDPEIGKAILESYFALTRDRKRYFDDARQQLSKDPRLAPHVQSHLESLGCHATWTEISTKKEPFSFDVFLKEMEANGSGSSETKPPPS